MNEIVFNENGRPRGLANVSVNNNYVCITTYQPVETTLLVRISTQYTGWLITPR